MAALALFPFSFSCSQAPHAKSQASITASPATDSAPTEASPSNETVASSGTKARRLTVSLIPAFDGVPEPTGQIQLFCGEGCTGTWSPREPAELLIEPSVAPLRITVSGDYIASPVEVRDSETEHLRIGVVPLVRKLQARPGQLVIYREMGPDGPLWFVEPSRAKTPRKELPTDVQQRREFFHQHLVDGKLRLIVVVGQAPDFKELSSLASTFGDEVNSRGGQLEFLVTDHSEREWLALQLEREKPRVILRPAKPLPPLPKVHLGASPVNGPLPPEVIRRLVRQRYGHFRACYQKGLGRDPQLSGRISTHFVIARDGSVSKVQSDASALPDREVVECVNQVFQTMSFPTPDGGDVKVTFELGFSLG